MCGDVNVFDDRNVLQVNREKVFRLKPQIVITVDTATNYYGRRRLVESQQFVHAAKA